MTKEASFVPSVPYELPELLGSIDLDSETRELLADARQNLEGLKGSLEFYEDPFQLVQIPALQESVSSSEIENIRTTVQGALEDSVKEERDQQKGNKEALNYRRAIFTGLNSMQKYGLSTRTILAIHSELEVKESGRLRSLQNEIQNEFGEPIYTPPRANDISRLLQNWENFVNTQKGEIHPIVKAIVAHYQFEAIHPFADGNGRTGRILMVLQLVNDGILLVPALYISGYLKEKSDLYKQLLLDVTVTRNWKVYIDFMLYALSIQSLKTRIILRKIHRFKNDFKRRIRSELSNIYSAELVNHLFSFPVTFANVMHSELGMDRRTAGKYLKVLEEKGYLSSKKSGKYVLYMNKGLIKILYERLN